MKVSISPWDFLEKPRHVTYLEKLSKELWKTQFYLPVVAGFSSEENAELWGYCLKRGLTGTKEGVVPDSEVPWVKVTKYIVTSAGLNLIDSYRVNTSRRRRRYY